MGRSSGKVYRTPLDAHPVDDGYLFVPVYGSGSDWVKNVLAAGTASLEIDGNELDLVSPRLLTERCRVATHARRHRDAAALLTGDRVPTDGYPPRVATAHPLHLGALSRVAPPATRMSVTRRNVMR